MQFNDSMKKTLNTKQKYFSKNRIDKFIEWYRNNILNENDNYVSETDLKNFIEKMAIWYEVRYPSYEINKTLPCISEEIKDINEIMFNENPYFKEVFGKFNMLKELEWDKFFNKDVFLNLLTFEEFFLLLEPTYTEELIFIDPDYGFWNAIRLNTDGIVTQAGLIKLKQKRQLNYKKVYDPKKQVSREDILGLHIKDVVSLIKERKIDLPKNNGLEEAIESYEKQKYFYNELLNCIVYRIIEREQCDIGMQRALLFAKEFDITIDLIKYAKELLSHKNLMVMFDEKVKLANPKKLISNDKFKEYDLNIKVKEFLRWYDINYVNRKIPENFYPKSDFFEYSDESKKYEINLTKEEIKNFIEKWQCGMR